MKKILKKYREGFSLIELMVVIVIVIILALALTPLFKEEIEKARFSEGISALGALNTKLKVYVAENNELPPENLVATSIRAIRLVNSTNDYHSFLVSTGEDDITVTAGRSPAQAALGISLNEYEGRYFKQDHYQYLNVDDNLAVDGTYMYAVAVVGGPGSRSNDVSKASPGTYYAVIVRQSSNDFFTLTKSDYSPVDKREKRLVAASETTVTLPLERQILMPGGLSSPLADFTNDGWK